MSCSKRIFFGLIPIPHHSWTEWVSYSKSYPSQIYPNFWDDGSDYVTSEHFQSRERRKCLVCNKAQDREWGW